MTIRPPAHPIAALRGAARTAIFFLEVLPNLPSRPVDWLTPEPVIERVRYPTPDGGEAEGELYRPPGAGAFPGVTVCLGVVPFAVSHPQVPRLGRALARAGFAALLFWSPAMRDVRLDPADVEGISLAYQWLIARPEIDPRRSGLLGTCVGGSFALLAAAEPAIRDDLAFVFAWAPYGSMRTLARDIASATTTIAGAVRPWAVDQLTRKVFVRTLTAELESEEAERMRAAGAEREAAADPGARSPAGRAISPLLTALDPDAAGEAVERLPAAMLARMDAMSPLGVVGHIRAPLVLLAHDVDDAVIPIAESRRIVAALGVRPGLRSTEFTMFKHLDPTKVTLPPLALGRELVKFYRCAYPIFRQTVRP